MNQAKNCTYDDCYKFQGPLIEMISLKTPMKLNIDKAVRILFFFMLFCLIFKIKNVVADELKPHNVAVESSYQEKNLRPAPPIHEFDLRYPGSSHEPYYPELTAGVYPLPPDFPQNIFFSRWTRFSGGLGELFLGDRGTLENAILLYQSGDKINSQKKFRSLLHSEPGIKEKATL